MALVKTNAVLTSQADAITALIDVGVPNGTLEFRTAADAEVATINFAATSFGGAVNGLATAAATVADTSATGNASPVTKFVIFDGNSLEVYRGSATITAGGGDIELSAVVIGAGSTVTLTSYTYQEA